ncbi:hypothetical protein [Halorussus ruber]|uniref:hypothetical protein n=1 Tax=Halorussus ruber TaxID=1126238 RepID=UPI0010933241|nr:hypothetical protein [Halorussus ruber]
MPTDTQRAGYAADSILVSLTRHIVAQLQMWIAASWLARAGTAFVDRLATAADASVIAKSGRTFAFWIHFSFFYRWLTKKPNPEVVVIDLRETYTVGPFIRLLNRLAPTVARIWQGSFVARITIRLRTAANAAWLTESKTVRLLRAALEPPELPDENER